MRAEVERAAMASRDALKSFTRLSYSAVRVFSLSRAEGRFRAFEELDVLALRDVRFVPSPRISAAGQELYNGVAGFGGARMILLERVSARRLFVNFLGILGALLFGKWAEHRVDRFSD